ncbi:PREDICTED: E3 ubiquitin-protein ligase TRAF7-like [Acropora digitifera]|uniref:E3 ubiquitin-protein ligase TRAF7-like n=1 Tax=Acropora digitifera TaxID=70779 RepID=UPI00077ACFA1|nr:PREDICTED: E3 ubiquitin-protein ligase TRAF7-like [Acropora digitifera]
MLQGLHSKSSEELRSSVQVLSERVSWLENNQDALMTEVEQCNSTVSRLVETVEDLSFQVEQLTVLLKRSSLYREMSVTSIPEILNSSQSPSPDESGVSYSYGPKSLVRLKPAAVVSTHQDAWSIPCVFKCIGTLRGHRGAIWSLVSRGHRLFSAGGDRVIKVWNMENVRQAKCTEVLEGHTGDIHTMCVGGGKLYSAGSDQAIISWNLENLTLHRRVENAHNNVICAIIYNGKYLFTSSHSCIKVWDASNLQEVHEMPDLHHWVRALALDVRREKLFSGSHNVVHIWDAIGSFCLRGTIDHSLGSVYSLATTRHFIIVGTYNQNIHLYDVNTYQSIKALVGHIGTVTALAPAVTGKLLFSASYDTTVQVQSLDGCIQQKRMLC